MAQLTPITLDDGTTIYIESSDDARMPTASNPQRGNTRGGNEALIAKGGMETLTKNFESLESTIRTYTKYTLNAFKEVAVANVEKVTLEFGVKVSGEAGIPYITKGTAESNLKITVQCSFPGKEK